MQSGMATSAPVFASVFNIPKKLLNPILWQMSMQGCSAQVTVEQVKCLLNWDDRLQHGIQKAPGMFCLDGRDQITYSSGSMYRISR